MPNFTMLPDATLIQITDAALADSYHRAGNWMTCHPGCHQCCIGVFPISSLDGARLREALYTTTPNLKQAIEQRAQQSRNRLTPHFPGNAQTGELFTEPHHEAAFEDLANDEACPVLDPITGTCDLYAARPIPCRTFGPPMPNQEGGLAVCELCFVNAPPEEVARCTVDATFLALEEQAIAAQEATTTRRGPTLIAFALSSDAAH